MTEEHSTATPAQTYADDVSPDSLMSDFRGRPVGSILAFTVIAHVVLVGIFSVGYLKNAVLGGDTSSMSEKERLDVAVREATTSLREIADRHGLSPQDLSERFAGGGAQPSAAGNPKPVARDVQDEPPVSDDPAAQEPKSAIEEELEKKTVGPELPDLPPLEEEEDLFK